MQNADSGTIFSHLIFRGSAVVGAVLLFTGFGLTDARADCTTSGTTATCTGDPGAISYDQDDGIDTVVVETLTSDIDTDGSYISLSEQGFVGNDDGDAGSDGSDATITFTGTNGDASYGVSGATATSIYIATAGGDGAAGESVDTTADAGDTGGKGGAGGTAGTATLTMTGGFISQTEGVTGLYAISEGGDGATGGEATFGNYYERTAGPSASGGDGGAGGAAGGVTVTLTSLSNSSADAGITVSGVDYGIQLQSVGGAGGAGGESRCDNEYSTGCNNYSGNGAAGGAAGDASLTITDTDVSISDFSAIGVEIASTGGSGGKAGLAKGEHTSYLVNNLDDSGNGGDGGTGGAVGLTLDGATASIIDTSSSATHGIAIATTGGAGGDSNDVELKNCTGYCYAGYGTPGTGGAGGAATLTLKNGSGLTVETSADEAIAVSLTATGGAGGTYGSFSHSDNESSASNDRVADGGDGGAGGAVSITVESGSTLSLTTSGSGGAMGALTLSSTGGAGGKGGDGSVYGDGDGGSGGDGGKISGTVAAVTATTGGSDAYGILLQSLGGAGATGKGSDGTGGDGGIIDLTFDTVSITTTGAGSHGLYALSQSAVGGDSSSGGDDGTAGNVSLTVSGGTISTSGAGAHGIVAISQAQSGGSGTAGNAGNVNVTTGASITASGSDAYGIYMESTSSATNGTLSLTVNSGGIVTAGTEAAAAVAFVNGSTTGNSIVNNGTITTADLTDSTLYAVSASGGLVSITNAGTFGGSLATDASYANSFTNTGTVEMGPAFDVGASGTFTNSGTMSPGGVGTVLTTSLTGVSTQSSDGVYVVDISTGGTDLIRFQTAGTVLAGSVQGNAVSISSANGTALIGLADNGTIDASALTVTNTSTASYTLDTTSDIELLLNYNISLTDSDALASANANQSALASHLQAVIENNGEIAGALAGLVNIVEASDYVAALDSLVPEVHTHTQSATLFSSMRLSDALLSCAAREGAYRFVQQDSCGWMRIGAAHLDRSDTAASNGYDQTSYVFSGGGQVTVHDVWSFGTAVSYETQTLDVMNLATSDGYFTQAGVVAKRRFGDTMLSASLSGGIGNHDVTRRIYTGHTLESSQSTSTVSGQISASHAFARDSWYIKPRIDLAFDQVMMDGFTETGVSGAEITVGSQSETYFNIQPAVEIGGEFALAGGTLLRPSLTVGLTQFLGDANPSLTASFAGTPASVAPLTVTSDFDETYLDLGAGLDILSRASIVGSIKAFGQFSDNTQSYGGSAKLAITF